MYIDSGVIIKRQDMKTLQEEVANMFVRRQVADVKAKEVTVVADYSI